MSIADELAEIFDRVGAQSYLGERVSMAEHMLQTAALAEGDGANDDLIVASLLHDIGHFHNELPGSALMRGTDNRHATTGADYLAQHFSPAVSEPVRHHVAAKRYLCAVDPAYFEKLSEASVYTLGVQGGPMNSAQTREFERNPFWREGVALRRWDDLGKVPGKSVPGFAHYRPLLEALSRREPR